MNDLLQETKHRLAARYLGQAGIHGFGLRRSEGAICVYLERHTGPEQKAILERIEREAAPFQLIAIHEDRPFLT